MASWSFVCDGPVSALWLGMVPGAEATEIVLSPIQTTSKVAAVSFVAVCPCSRYSASRKSNVNAYEALTRCQAACFSVRYLLRSETRLLQSCPSQRSEKLRLKPRPCSLHPHEAPDEGAMSIPVFRIIRVLLAPPPAWGHIQVLCPHRGLLTE